MDRKRYCLRSSTNKYILFTKKRLKSIGNFPDCSLGIYSSSRWLERAALFLQENRRILLKARLRRIRDSLPFSRQRYFVWDSPANLYRDFMPTRMKFGKVFLSGFTSLARSASTEVDVLHKCRLPSQSWTTLLYRNASGQDSACQCFLALRAKATVIVLLLWADHSCSCQGPLAFSTERTTVALQSKIVASVRARAIRLAGRSEPIWFSIAETGSVCFWPNRLREVLSVSSGSGFIPGASRKLC